MVPCLAPPKVATCWLLLELTSKLQLSKGQIQRHSNLDLETHSGHCHHRTKPRFFTSRPKQRLPGWAFVRGDSCGGPQRKFPARRQAPASGAGLRPFAARRFEVLRWFQDVREYTAAIHGIQGNLENGFPLLHILYSHSLYCWFVGERYLLRAYPKTSQ